MASSQGVVQSAEQMELIRSQMRSILQAHRAEHGRAD